MSSRILKRSQSADTLSSSILERSWSEAGWKDIRSGSKFGYYDNAYYNEPMKETHFSISGNKSKAKDPKEDQENIKPPGVVSPIKKCIYCSQKGHSYDQCMIRITIENAKAEHQRELARKPKCEMCEGEHDTLDCFVLAPYRAATTRNEKFVAYNVEIGDEWDAPKSPTFSDPPDLPTFFDPIGETPSRKKCAICYKEHYGLSCPYLSSVPKGEDVSPFFPIVCQRCDNAGMNNDLWCSHCQDHATGYVISRIKCLGCSKRMTPTCCPYGELIEKKNKRTGYICPIGG